MLLTLKEYQEKFEQQPTSTRNRYNAIKRLKKYMGVTDNKLDFLKNYKGILKAIKKNNLNLSQSAEIFKAIKKFSLFHKLDVTWVDKEYKKITVDLNDETKLP